MVRCRYGIFQKVSPVLFLFGPNKENTTVLGCICKQSTRKSCINPADESSMCSHLSVFIAAPDSLIGKALCHGRARKAANEWMLLSWEVLGSRQGFVDLVPTHNESVWRAVCSSAWASVLLLNFFHSIKRLFLFQSLSFSFTPEPLQLRHKRNLPAAAFVLAFQEA